MDSVAIGMFALHGLFWGLCFIILIVLVFRRIEEKKDENLDEYDN